MVRLRSLRVKKMAKTNFILEGRGYVLHIDAPEMFCSIEKEYFFLGASLFELDMVHSIFREEVQIYNAHPM